MRSNIDVAVHLLALRLTFHSSLRTFALYSSLSTLFWSLSLSKGRSQFSLSILPIGYRI